MHHVSNFLELVRSNPAAVALLAGFVTPLIVSVLQQPNLSKRQRTAVAAGAALALGAATAYSTGLVSDATDLITIIVVLYTASETAYQRLWKQIGVTSAIEDFTALPGARVDVEADSGSNGNQWSYIEFAADNSTGSGDRPDDQPGS